MRLRHSLAIAFFSLSALGLAGTLAVAAILLLRTEAGEFSWILGLVGLAALPPLALLAYALARSYADPIERFVRAAGLETDDEGDLTPPPGEGDQEGLSLQAGPATRSLPEAEGATELALLSAEINSLRHEVLHHRAQQERRRRQLLELLESMSAGVVVLSEDGRVVLANRAAAQILGAPEGTLAGRPLVHSARNFPVQPLIDQALDSERRPAADRPVRDTVALLDGRLLTVEVIPLHHTADDTRHILLFIRDETPRLRTERMRRDFVANVSHELKTPLAGLTLLASTLHHAVEEDPQQAQVFADRLSGELERLNDLVNDLLTLSRLEDGVAAPELREHLDLAEIATTVAREMRPAFADQDRHLALLAKEPVMVWGNAILLETLTRNLLENSLRYTDPGGHVKVRVTSGADTALLSVEDDGIGIPKDEQGRIFERFYRVDKARSRQTGGTGLGLSIVRHIAEQHGGSVEVASVVGVGTTFTVRLPLASVATTQAG